MAKPIYFLSSHPSTYKWRYLSQMENDIVIMGKLAGRNFFRMGSISPRVDFTKLWAPSEKTPAHGVWQKIRRSISPTKCYGYVMVILRLNLPNAVRCLPNLCAEKSFSFCAREKVGRKCWWNRPQLDGPRFRTTTFAFVSNGLFTLQIQKFRLSSWQNCATVWFLAQNLQPKISSKTLGNVMVPFLSCAKC